MKRIKLGKIAGVAVAALVLMVLSAEVALADLSSVTFSPTEVIGGGSATGTVTFDEPTDGAVVSLESSNPDVVTVPEETVVSGGESSGQFPVTTTSVTSTIEVTVTATAFGVTRTGTLIVEPGDPPPPDTVEIEKARQKQKGNGKVLEVEATSTNPDAIMTVFLGDGTECSDSTKLGTMTNLGDGKYEFEFASRFDIETITVKSNFGGSDTVDVEID